MEFNVFYKYCIYNYILYELNEEIVMIIIVINLKTNRTIIILFSVKMMFSFICVYVLVEKWKQNYLIIST